MSYINFPSKMLFGRDGTQALRSVTDAQGQALGETVATTTSRTFVGPQKGGRFSIHLVANAGSESLAGALEVHYSNYPNPDKDTDSHWVKDTSTGASATITAGSLSTAFLAAGNVLCTWVRVKLVRSSGSGPVVVWIRYEGDQSAP